MIDTSRIRTGFDVELNLGAGWIRIALQALADAGKLIPADAPPPFQGVLVITSVEILFGGNRDLRVDATLDEVPVTILATVTLQLGDDGLELAIDTNIPGVTTTIPFDALDDVVGTPALAKVAGDDDVAPALAVLANIDLRASPQSGDPLPAGEHVPRGEALLAQSFLPPGKDIVMGVGRDAFPRFANDVWHTELRADDGSHPLPDEDDKRGEWTVVRMDPQNGRLRLTLLGTVPIDLFPDGKVTVTVDLTPRIDDGALAFEVSIDTDVDTGLFGDLWAAVLGGFVGLVIGFFTGGVLLSLGTGAILGVIALEVAEVIVNGKVRKQVRARLAEEPLVPVLACNAGDVIVEALPHDDEDGGIALGPLDAIPRSIPVNESNPDLLHTQFVLVTTDFDELATDGSGFAAAGMARPTERFVPRPGALVRKDTAPDADGTSRVELVYTATDPEAEEPTTVEVALGFDDVIGRATSGALEPPLRLRPLPAEADETRRDGRVPSVCLSPTNVRRRETEVTDIRFSTGVELTVGEAVALQDSGAIVLRGVQLIHPQDDRPYFRSFADASLENNFENLPPF